MNFKKYPVYRERVRHTDGKLVEHWGNRDDLGMLQQLGAIPAIE